MAFTVERANFYDRKQVENIIAAIEAHWTKIAENQPDFARKHPLWKHLIALSIAESMRLARVQIYRNEDWVIQKDGEFVAYAISRDIKRGLYPILLYAPLNWDSQDALDGLEAFILKWIDEGFRKFWIRLPIKLNPLEKITFENLTWKYSHSYPEPKDKAPYPPKWDIYKIEVQE